MKNKRFTQSRTSQILNYHSLEDRKLLSANSPSAEFSDLIRDSGHAIWQSTDVGTTVVDSQLRNGVETTLLQQTYRGMPVVGSFVTVAQSAENGVQLNGLDLAVLPTDSVDSVIGTASGAVSLATNELDLSTTAVDASLAWFNDGSQTSLVWQVSIQEDSSSVQTLADEMILVDLAGTSILHRETLATVDQLFQNPATRIGEFARIVINDDIGPAGSQDFAAPFDAVVALPGCTGTLIAANVVVSARHCGSSAGDVIRFGDNSLNPDFTATVTSVDVPAGAGTLLDGGDLNILFLDQDIPESVAKPMRLTDFTTELEGMVANTLGYGLNGVGSTGHQFSSDGLRWGGQNIIDAYGTPAGTFGSNIISTDFDDGSAGANTIPSGDADPLEFEATTAPGDSGGPILVQLGADWVVAGVLSGGTTSTSVYGDISWWTGIEPYRDVIEAAGGTFYTDGMIEFDADAYGIGDTVTIMVEDAFATEPFEVVVTSSVGDTETVTVSHSSGDTFTGTITLSGDPVAIEDGTLQVASSGSITASYGLGASDSAIIQTIQGTNGDDVIIVHLTDGIQINLNGVDLGPIDSSSGSIDALGGNDQITIYDNSGNDSVTMDGSEIQLFGNYNFLAQSVEQISVISGGGNDTATFRGTDRSEDFSYVGDTAMMTGEQVQYSASGYTTVMAFGMGGFDQATLNDTTGNDTFYATETFANIRSGAMLINVRDFSRVEMFSVAGGYDTLTLSGTTGDDALVATSMSARIELGDQEIIGNQFDRVTAIGNGGEDRASFVGTPADDIFNTRYLNSYLYGDGFFLHALNFKVVNANAGAGDDLALMFDTPGNDTLYATPDFAALSNSLFRTRATDFEYVNVRGSAGIDSATLVDSAGNDRFIARPTDSYLIGDGYLNRVMNFNRVTATSTAGIDRAVLTGSFEDNRFVASREESYLTGSTFFNSAENFRYVTANLAGAGLYIGTFQDSTGDDTVFARQNRATLYGDDYLVEAIGLDRLVATSDKGGVDRLFADLAAFDVFDFGDWI